MKVFQNYVYKIDLEYVDGSDCIVNESYYITPQELHTILAVIGVGNASINHLEINPIEEVKKPFREEDL